MAHTAVRNRCSSTPPHFEVSSSQAPASKLGTPAMHHGGPLRPLPLHRLGHRPHMHAPAGHLTLPLIATQQSDSVACVATSARVGPAGALRSGSTNGRVGETRRARLGAKPGACQRCGSGMFGCVTSAGGMRWMQLPAHGSGKHPQRQPWTAPWLCSRGRLDSRQGRARGRRGRGTGGWSWRLQQVTALQSNGPKDGVGRRGVKRTGSCSGRTCAKWRRRRQRACNHGGG